MEEVPREALFPSKHNTLARNALNIANIVAGIVGGASYIYLGGLFAPPNLGSSIFWAAIIGMTLCFGIQAIFAVVPTGYGTSVR
jgi:hypothetical protein